MKEVSHAPTVLIRLLQIIHNSVYRFRSPAVKVLRPACRPQLGALRHPASRWLDQKINSSTARFAGARRELRVPPYPMPLPSQPLPPPPLLPPTHKRRAFSLLCSKLVKMGMRKFSGNGAGFGIFVGCGFGAGGLLSPLSPHQCWRSLAPGQAAPLLLL
jgi:hypothetical protein